MVTPTARRLAVGFVQDGFGVSQRRSCDALGVARSTCRYQSQRSEDPVRAPLRELATRRPRFGYRRLGILLRREGWTVNDKRVYRLYRADGLAVRRRKRRKLAAGARIVLTVPNQPNQRWSMDFMGDTLASGRTFRTLNIVDDCSRECLEIEVDTSISGVRVTRVLDRIAETRPLPDVIVVDNGPEFTSKALDAWAYGHGVRLQFIRPGKPVDNAFVESFNGKFRDECLNEHWFQDLADARAKIGAWKTDYNEVRPHSALGNRTPIEFATVAGLTL
jgi:putative transposase